MVWLFIHIGFLTGYRNRIGAVLSWWWFAFSRDLRRERTFTTEYIDTTRDIYTSTPPLLEDTPTAPRGREPVALAATRAAGLALQPAYLQDLHAERLQPGSSRRGDDAAHAARYGGIVLAQPGTCGLECGR